MDLRPPPHPSYLSSLKSWLDDLYIFLQSLFRYDRQVSPYEVDHGAAGQGFSLYDILTNIGTTTKATVVFKRAGTYTVSSRFNASSYTNVYFQFEPGAILSVADLGTWSASSGFTWSQLSSSLTTGIWNDVLNTLILPSPGHIIASPTQQIFSGAGSVVFSNPGEAFIEWWGAKGDYSTDNATAIQKAFDDCYSSYTAYDKRMTLLFKAKKGYITTAALTCKRGIDLIMDSPIYYQGTSNITVLTIGEASQLNIEGKMRLAVERITQGDWTSTDCIGLKIINLGRSTVEIADANNFTIGAQLIGDAQGFVYNTVTLGRIVNNKYGLELTNTNTGWCNENLFLNGMFVVNVSVNATLARAAVRITSQDGGYYNNKNVFIKPSFEIGSADASDPEDIPVLIEYGNKNTFMYCRAEGNHPTIFARISNTSYANILNDTYNYEGILALDDDSTSLPFYNSYTDAYFTQRALGRLVFDSGAIHKKTIVANGTTGFSVAGLSIHATGTTHAPTLSATITALTSNYLDLGSDRLLGIYVDTIRAKNFIVFVDADSGYMGRFAISCWDSSGTQLTSAGGNHPYVIANPTVTYNTAYGGSYYSGGDTTIAFKFKVHTDVAKIYLMIGAGLAATRIRSFQVYTTDDSSAITATAWNPLVEAIPGCFMASAIPTYRADIFKRGQVLWDNTPTSGATMGWTCVSQVSTTVSGDELTGQTTITVADATGISNGDRVTIALDSGAFHETTVNGVPIGNDVVITDALPSQASSGNGFYTMLWKAMPNLT